MKAIIVIITLVCFIPPVVAVFDIIRKVREQKYMDDAQDLFYKEIVKSIDEQKKKNAEKADISAHGQEEQKKKESENTDISDRVEDRVKNEEKSESIHQLQNELAEDENNDIKDNSEEADDKVKKEEPAAGTESKAGIDKDAALDIVMNMLISNRDNKTETSSQDLKAMIGILNEAKKSK